MLALCGLQTYDSNNNITLDLTQRTVRIIGTGTFVGGQAQTIKDAALLDALSDYDGSELVPVPYFCFTRLNLVTSRGSSYSANNMFASPSYKFTKNGTRYTGLELYYPSYVYDVGYYWGGDFVYGIM